ncbi:MAG TPA: sigma-70 family RNA polymerase sigma factor [Acidobacteriota bacterium]|nr:sigma-70 family RNA polymerase sigma factor [Acidobacteriota bacterium]
MEKRDDESRKFHPDDREQILVERLKRRSSQAFDELVSCHGHRLQGVAMRILRNAQDAEDCVQETFLKAFQSISSFRGQASLSTWLYRIATNLALSRLRKKRRTPLVDVDSRLPDACARHPSAVRDWSRMPETALLRRELADQVRKLIAELPETYRLPYVLKDLEKLSESEVCQALGLPKSTIKSRVHRARVFIRSELKERRLGPAPAVPAGGVLASLAARSGKERNHG